MILAAVFTAAEKCSEPKPTIALLEEILRSYRSTVGDGSGVEDETLWDIVNADYGFLSSVAATGRPPSQTDHQKWADLLGWIIAGLRSWTEKEDLSGRRLRVILLLTRTMDWDDAFWPALPNEIAANGNLMVALAEFVRSTKIELGAGIGPQRLGNEIIEQFKRADENRDWSKLGEIYPWLFDYFGMPMFTQAVRCLRRFNFAGLVSATNELSGAMVTGTVALALCAEDALRLALESANPYQRFCSVHRSLDRREVLTDSAQCNLSSILVQISADDTTWRAWMKVFNTYPVRFPTLQVPLGRALASVEPSAIAGYVESLSLHVLPQTERSLAAQCLRAFRADADLARRQALWTAAYSRWASWDFGRIADELQLTSVSGSVLDYAIVGYFVEVLSATDLAARIQAIMLTVNSVDCEWHASLICCVGARNQLLSQLQLLEHAKIVAGTEIDWLLEGRIYSVNAGPGNNYYAAKYRAH